MHKKYKRKVHKKIKIKVGYCAVKLAVGYSMILLHNFMCILLVQVASLIISSIFFSIVYKS